MRGKGCPGRRHSSYKCPGAAVGLMCARSYEEAEWQGCRDGEIRKGEEVGGEGHGGPLRSW